MVPWREQRTNFGDTVWTTFPIVKDDLTIQREHRSVVITDLELKELLVFARDVYLSRGDKGLGKIAERHVECGGECLCSYGHN